MLRPFALATILALTASTAMADPPKRDEAEKVADSRDKVICKSFVETGSLVATKRVCKTKWEWEREREDLRTLHSSQSCSKLGNGGSCG